MLALCVNVGECASSSSETVWVDEAAPVSPSDALWAAELGSHVRAVFRNGDRATGYLVAKDPNEFTLRGVGWQATQVTTYEVKDVVDFVVSDPQPNTEVVRY